jgi:hypothetical membrane protein
MDIRTQSPRPSSALLAAGALLGLAVYVALDVLLAFLPPHYSVIYQPESDYGVGPYGYLMGFNFLLRGLLSLAVVSALWPRLSSQAARLGLALVALWALASMLLAAFPTDVEGAVTTTHGKLHALLALIAFLGALIGELLLSSTRVPEDWWHHVVAPARFLAWLAVPALLWTFVALAHHTAESGTAGLAERVFLGLVLAWLGVVGYRLRYERSKAMGRAYPHRP